MQGVFNPNILIYHPPNSAEGLHFSAFHVYVAIIVNEVIFFTSSMIMILLIYFVHQSHPGRQAQLTNITVSLKFKIQLV